MPVLEITDLSKEFLIRNKDKNSAKKGFLGLFSVLSRRNRKHNNHKKIFALKNINFSLDEGKSLGVIGLNGTGKSTLLQIIAGTLKPTSGDIVIKGKVAALLELGAGFNPEFTGRENVYLNASLFGLEKKQIDQKFSKIKSFADIGGFINEPVKTYSSGMYVRLAFAIVANLEPSVLIIDESLSVGDAKFQFKCFAFLQDFKDKGGSLIMVSHDLNSIARLSDKVLLLHDGIVMRSGKPIDVINYYSKLISDSEIESSQQRRNVVISHKKYEEMDYGGLDGIILNSKILNSSNIESKILKSGEDFHICFSVIVKKVILNPIFSVRIRDIKGVEIYGTNTMFSNAPTPNPLKEGQTFDINFSLKGNLSSGTYLVSLGLSKVENKSFKVIHRRRECIEFEVINDDGSFGIANCFSSVMIRENKLLE